MFLTKPISPLLLGIILVSFINATHAGKLYRWVDSEGNVHYTDQLPPEQAQRARTQLNERGLEIEHTGAAKTAEEIEQERELKRLRAEQERLLREQRAKDRVLLRTFRTEEDILLARNGKLAAVDVMIQISRSIIRRTKKKLNEMRSNAASFERQGKKIPEKLLANIETTEKQIQDGYSTIVRQEQKKSDIIQQFTEYLARFRKLKNLEQEKRTRKTEKRDTNSFLDLLVPCGTPTSCDEAWLRAEKYVRKHATTALQTISKTVIITAPPKKHDDISLTVSRIKRGGEEKIFLDLQCSKSSKGAELCESEQVHAIRSGFRAALLRPDS